MKICNVCKVEKPTLSFAVNRTKKSGRSDTCLVCARERNKAWYDKNRKKQITKTNQQRKLRRAWMAELVWQYAESCGCAICGEKDRIVLEFHHLRDKKFMISWALGNAGWESIANEIAKCVILCANCHRRVHAGTRSVADCSPCDITRWCNGSMTGFEPVDSRSNRDRVACQNADRITSTPN